MAAPQLSLAEEKKLFRRACRGDKAARERIVELWRPRIRGICEKRKRWLYRSKSDRITLDDVEHEVWAEVFRKMEDTGKSVAELKRRAKAAGSTNVPSRYDFNSDARPLSWLHAWIESAADSFICKNLEVVSIGDDSTAHAAHAELERGGNAEEIAARRGMSVERVRSLERHTVSIIAASNVGVGPSTDDVEDANELSEWHSLLAECFADLTPRQRAIIAALAEGLSESEIADYLRVREHIPPAQSRVVIAHAIRAARRLVEQVAAT